MSLWTPETAESFDRARGLIRAHQTMADRVVPVDFPEQLTAAMAGWVIDHVAAHGESRATDQVLDTLASMQGAGFGATSVQWFDAADRFRFLMGEGHFGARKGK